MTDQRGRLLAAALGLVGAMLLTGCGGGPIVGPPAVTDPDQAAIVVFIRSPFDGLITMTLTIDGVRVAELASREHVRMTVPDGERILGIEWFDVNALKHLHRTMTLKAEPRRTYYVQVEAAQIFRITDVQGLKLVDETTGRTPEAAHQ
jgi:hypothetical protein